MFILCLSQYSPTAYRQEHIFPDFCYFPWLFPAHFQIPWLLQVFQVSGHPVYQAWKSVPKISSDGPGPKCSRTKNDVYEAIQIRHMSIDWPRLMNEPEEDGNLSYEIDNQCRNDGQYWSDGDKTDLWWTTIQIGARLRIADCKQPSKWSEVKWVGSNVPLNKL